MIAFILVYMSQLRLQASNSTLGSELQIVFSGHLSRNFPRTAGSASWSRKGSTRHACKTPSELERMFQTEQSTKRKDRGRSEKLRRL